MDTEKRAILIVEDNPLNRELIAAAVTSALCRCVEAINGREALARAKNEVFSLIFMDLLMPGMDGFETVRHLRAMGIETPIVALSALSMKQDQERAIAMGCNAFVPKPIDLAQLRDIIEKYGQREPHHQPPKSTSILQPVSRPSFDFSPYRLLVVEEDRQRADEHVRTMGAFGFSVLHAANCNQALDMLHDDPGSLDIIVSNLYTTGIDAMGMLAMVRRQFPQVMVFIYTERYDPDMYQLAMQQGADGIFPAALLNGPAIGMIESALYRRQQPELASAALSDQLRQAQAQLISYGCEPPCQACSLAFKSLHEAGGDIVRCRKFNKSGRCGFVLADIAGHDLASLYMSAVFLGILTSCWDACQKPVSLLQVINSEFYKLGYPKSHVCVTAMLWDGIRRIMHIATAGNPGALLYERSAGGEYSCREIVGGGMCLGLLKSTDLIGSAMLVCPSESYLFLFSDGIEKETVQKAIAADPAFFNKHKATGMCSQILQHARPGQQDDMALLSFYIPHPEPQRHPSYSFLTGYDGIDRACRWAAEVLATGKVPRGKDPDFILLALREALLNAVEHGNRRSGDAFVDIVIRSAPDELVIEVSDEGAGFDLERCVTADAPDSQLGKRGVPAMRKISDMITVEGGTVSMTFCVQ
jgi:CheY-like chemotaxis protein